jgi:hypothetical protein
LIFRQITPTPHVSRNFHPRVVLLISGETNLRRTVSKSWNFAYFGKPGWRANEWNFLRQFPESSMSALRAAAAFGSVHRTAESTGN